MLAIHVLHLLKLLADIDSFFLHLTMTTITNIVTRATQQITITTAAVLLATTTVSGNDHEELTCIEAKVKENRVSLTRVVKVIVALSALAILDLSVNTLLHATHVE